MIVENRSFRNKIHIYETREQAGEILGELIKEEQFDILYIIPNGGLPVGYGLINYLKSPVVQFDLLIVKKVHVPWSTEAGMGAITPDGQIFLNEKMVGNLSINDSEIKNQIEKAKELAERNVSSFKNAGIEKIITSCAGCYRTWKEIYPNKFGLDHGIDVKHLPEFLIGKLENGELKFTKELIMKITYHDPCHIGRHMGIYEAPRELLQKIPGIELLEMSRNRNNAWCCGSGGGVRSAFKDLSGFAANERIEEAKETTAETIVSCCPFCLNQFKNNIKDNEIQALDLSEIVRKAI